MIQIQCPNIIKIHNSLAGHDMATTEDDKLGADQRHGIVVTTVDPGTIDHDASPLSRLGYWNGRSPDQLE